MSASAVLRRRLAVQLRELRSDAGMSQDKVAEQLDVSVRTVMRAEASESTIGAKDLAGLLSIYGAGRETRDRLVELGKQARKRGGWWSSYKDLLPGPYMQLEAEAALVRNYEPLIVPGLLQTESYAQAVLRTIYTDEEVIERHVAARMRRQERVTSGDLAVDAILDEAVLHRMSPVARIQLRHLAEVAALPNVRIRIVEWGVGLYRTVGLPFAVLRFTAPIDPDVAITETVGGERYFDDAEEVAAINAIFDEVGEQATAEDQSTVRIMDGLKGIAQ